jgi:TonB family protein
MRISMKLFEWRLLAFFCAVLSAMSWAQQSKPTPAPTRRPVATPTPTAKITSKPAPGTSAQTPVNKPKSEASANPAVVKQTVTAEQLLEQGKAFYKTSKFPQALAKFEAALKLDETHDEALALAAVTAYRLDDQVKARTWFLRRAELPNQKESVRAYSFYRTALSYWREAHDEIALNGEYKNGQTVFKLPDKSLAQVEEQLSGGLYYAERAITLVGNYAEAHNLKNLLHSEYLFFISNEKKLVEHRRAALAALRRTFELMKEKDPLKWAADFGTPTLLVGEFAPTDAEAEKTTERMSKLLEGGEVVKRAAAIFPSIRSAKAADPSDASGSGVTKEGGAYSLGSGRGALTAAYAPGKVKVEVLISTSGEVVFAHVVQGRSDLNGAAVVAARKWKFSPAKFEGKPVQVSGVITFDMRPSR